MGMLSRRILAVAVFVTSLGGVFAACHHAPDAATNDEAAMRAGLDALYTRNDPTAAAAEFRQVLEHNHSHYGATYQLATALDRAGKRDEARPFWQRVLEMSEGYHDAPIVAKARERLGAAATPEALMRDGLDLLYTRNHPLAAAEKFRQVLEQNPDHYGATYQLAAALDAAGKPEEALPVWQKILAMAEKISDLKTADAARARIARGS